MHLGLKIALGKRRFGGGGGAAYLLDTYTAAAAYSVRLLKTGETECLRVRRASDNAELTIGFSGSNIDTTSLQSHCAGTDGFTVTWFDQSGNNRDVTQATTGNQSQIVSGGTTITDGGFAAPTFADSIPQSLFNSINFMASVTNLWVFQVSNLSDDSIFISDNGTSSQSWVLAAQSGSTNTTLAGSNGTYTEHWTNGTQSTSTQRGQVYTEVIGSKKILTIQGATGSGWTNGLGVSAYSSDSFKYTGVCQEYIVFHTDQSANRSDIESNINSYFGVF